MIRNICVKRRPLRVSTMKKVKITTVIILLMCTKYTIKHSLTRQQQGACCSAIFHPLTRLIQTTDDYFLPQKLNLTKKSQQQLTNI